MTHINLEVLMLFWNAGSTRECERGSIITGLPLLSHFVTRPVLSHTAGLQDDMI